MKKLDEVSMLNFGRKKMPKRKNRHLLKSAEKLNILLMFTFITLVLLTLFCGLTEMT